ncbi:hypothetical protein PQ478_08530 [Alkalihalophilus pseudofirmus]|uniref:hypothetical protein n=1 Tax=Alkalihalophilus pseudofirmus TaxID=79885 RepID=UPI00259B66A0|nr:hypothetical protein [Alkalihalophilus pseudofirmus]WEG18514.1 hypothetical protein PQ478_08530 [Alkalihalophilus pseudofirmus]
MPNLFKFQEEEQHHELECRDCGMLKDYYEMILDSDTEDELRELIESLFFVAKEEGYKQCLVHGAVAQMKLLDELNSQCPPDCDCEDECEF